MKKILALALALTMILSMSAFAFADTLENAGSKGKDITVSVVPFTGDVFAVTINWTDLTFTYTFTDWDPQNHEYVGSWTKDTASISVHNDSNITIKASAAVQEDVTTDNITISLVDDTPLTLGIDEGGSFQLKPTEGSAPNTRTGNVRETLTVAAVLVTIAKA